MHVFVCVFLTNHQWPSERQHELSDIINNDAIESVNQKSVSDSSYCKINCNINQYDLIQQIVQFHWSSFYSSARHISLIIARVNISTSIYLFARQSSSAIARTFFITVRDIWREHTHSSVKSTHSLRYCSEKLFNSLVMKSSIFAFSSSIKYFDCNITLVISHSITTSISPSLKSLFTYDERVASLKFCLRFLETARHFKTVMIVVDFSEDDDSDFNYMQCFICSLLLYSEYFTFESLKKHLQNASHCSLALQLQQEIESKIVEKPKIESSPASPVKPLSTYEKRLTILTNWFWFASLSKETVTAAEFRGIDDEYRARCMHCSLTIAKNRKFESLKKHLQKSSQCSLVLQLETTRLEISEAIVEASKSTSLAANLDYFDSTLLRDIQKFNLFCEIANFVQQLRQCQHQYRKSDLLTLLIECFRDSALIWYKLQSEKKKSEIVKKNLSEWLEVLIIAFSAKSLSESSIQISTSASRPSSQYHSCLNCFAFFSSLTRLLQHNQSICKKVVCKQCDEAFESNNKFHEHVRQHHAAKKIIKIASRRSFNREKDKSSTTISTPNSLTSPTSFKTTTKFSISRSVTLSERSRNSSTSLVTSAAIASATPKRSRLSLSTFKLTSKSAKTASVCSLTSLATSPSMLRKPQKSHLTIDDLIRMFREKSRSFDLTQHQNRHLFSRSPRTLYQSRIIAYFLPAVYQKTPITQSLKSSKSKSFQQHTPAKPLPLYRLALSEKSTFSSYKMTGISYISLQSTFSSRFSFLQSRFSFRFSLTSSSLLESSLSDSHVCCICFDHSSFRNDLFNYRRLNQRHSSNRRSMREMMR